MKKIMVIFWLAILVVSYCHNSILAQVPDIQLRVHRASSVLFSVTNFGFIGSQNGELGDEEGHFLVAPGAQFPAYSNIDYLFQGALWIGAAIDTTDNLGQPILDTLVSVGNDGWWSQIFELFPPDSQVTSMWRDSTLADEEIYAIYSDTCTNPIYVMPDPNNGHPHIPLGVTVHQRSMGWRTSGRNEIFLLDYLIENIYLRPLHDVWVGIYYDGDVYHSSENPYNPEQGAQDDLCGFIEREGNRGIAWLADNDGQPYNGQYDYRSPTGVMGMMLLHPLDGTQTNFNWWISNINFPLDWGPRRIENGTDPFPGGGMGTPGGDKAKYYVMSNGEHDYDQAWCAIPHDGWIPPVSNAPNLANGYDTRFLISFGPMQIAAGAVETVTVAYMAGANLHNDPSNYTANLRDHEADSASITRYYAGLDFSSLIANADTAYGIYQQVGIEEDVRSLPERVSLSQNYPNPFNAQTVISYSLPKTSDVSIGIFDIQGRKIETIAEGTMPAGEHSVIWDPGGQSSGIYFYRIKAGDKIETRKMVLIK